MRLTVQFLTRKVSGIRGPMEASGFWPAFKKEVLVLTYELCGRLLSLLCRVFSIQVLI